MNNKRILIIESKLNKIESILNKKHSAKNERGYSRRYFTHRKESTSTLQGISGKPLHR